MYTVTVNEKRNTDLLNIIAYARVLYCYGIHFFSAIRVTKSFEYFKRLSNDVSHVVQNITDVLSFCLLIGEFGPHSDTTSSACITV